MKFVKKVVCFALILLAVNMGYNIKCSAAEVQYTENVIPVMTSNTSPSGEASASSEWTRSIHYAAYLAFDRSTTVSSTWGAAENTSNGWLAYEFPDAKCITKYTVAPRNYSGLNQLPKDWTFEAWDEQLNQWVVLDTNTGVTGWKIGIKKEYTFTNTTLYNKYRINVTKSGVSNALTIGELEMMETVSLSTNLIATAGDAKVQLSWDAVSNATSYNIKRSTTPGGSYVTVASGSAISYTDTDVTNGTTYYYVVSSIVSDTESVDSNEVLATPIAKISTFVLKVVLEVDEQLQLSVDDDLDENTNMIWTSSDNSVAIVDKNGEVTAIKPGNTVVTVTSEDGSYTDVINILVVDDAKELRLAVDLKVGKSCRLTVDDLTDTVNVTWISMDPSIATISNKGKVTAINKGLTLITAIDENGNQIGQVYVRVRE